MTLRNKLGSKCGFSLTELLVVVGILALIAIIAIPVTVGIIEKTNNENDEVLAGIYTEYMQKFATEQAGSAEYYGTLSNDGVGSEYELLQTGSGKGAFPGVAHLNDKINNADTEDAIWRLIRKEACIAIKAYGDVDIADNDNYYIEKPHDKDKAFVYYYLTGQIVLKEIDDMKPVTQTEVDEGSLNTDDYWVFLDREGGSGKAVALQEGKRDFYVKVVQFGLESKALTGATVTIKLPNGVEKSAVTSNNGLIVFRDVADAFNVSVTKDGAIPFPNAEYYPGDDGHINLEANPNVGKTMGNPYVIALKMGCIGDVVFLETIKTYDYTAGSGSSFISQVKPITQPNNFDVQFDVTGENGRNESYSIATPTFNPMKLLGADMTGSFKFLMYGDYAMNINNTSINPDTQNPYFLTYNEGITSFVFGIYNTANPGEYPSKTDAYTYPVILQRNDTYIKGQLASENGSQPLHGKVNPALLPSTSFANNVASVSGEMTVISYVYAVNKNNRNEYYLSDALVPSGTAEDGSILYDFEVCLANEHEGDTFEIFVYTVYGSKDSSSVYGSTIKRLDVAQWPDSIVADGSTYILNSVNEDGEYTSYSQVDIETDVATTDFDVRVFDAVINRPLKYTATIHREGYSSNNALTHQTQTSNGASNNGIAHFTNVKKGYYRLTIQYADAYGYEDEEHIIFVDDGNYVIVKTPELIDYTITCIPVTKSGATIPGNGLLGPSTNYEAIRFQITIDGQVLPESLYTVDYGSVTRRSASSYNDNRVVITFKYGVTAEELVVTQEVLCFENSDTSADADMLRVKAPINEKFDAEFNIHRCETEESSTKDHATDSWRYELVSGNAMRHHDVCQRCHYARYEADHYVDGQDGSTDKVAWYTTVFSANDNKISSLSYHVKACTVCKQHTENESCTDDKQWVAAYNYATPSKEHGTITVKGLELIGATPTEEDQYKMSDKHHYRHCSFCYTRMACENHESKWSGGVHTNDIVKKDGYKYKDINGIYHQYVCKDCGYTQAAIKHNKKEVTKYYDVTGKNEVSSSNFVIKEIIQYCEDCGHVFNKDTIDHKHNFVMNCGYRHTTGAQKITGCGSGSHWEPDHCWAFGCGKRDSCDKHSTASFYCMTCACGVSSATYKNYGINASSKNDKISKWCGAHYYSKANVRWATTYDGKANRHCGWIENENYNKEFYRPWKIIYSVHIDDPTTKIYDLYN